MKLNIIFILLFFPSLVFAQGNGLYEFIGKNGKHGFMDERGKVIISAEYFRIAYPGFKEGLAFVSKKQASNGDFIWICIDTLGRRKFSIEKKCHPKESFNEGYAVISSYEKCWFINRKGKQVFNKTFGDACQFSNGYARVSNTKSAFFSFFIDKNGNEATHLPHNGSIFINGISYTGRQLIDTLGNVLIDNISEWTGASSEYLKVRRKKKWGFIDRKGTIVIDFQYEQDRKREFDKLKKINTDSLDAIPKAVYRNVGFFSEGFASIQKDSLFGFINLKNEIVIEPIFKAVICFSEGFAGATLDGVKWGFINTEGKFVIEPQYYYVDFFVNGICGVLYTYDSSCMNDYYLNAIINKNNEILYRGEMHSYGGFRGELIKFYEGRDFGGEIYYLDKNGKQVIPKE